MNAVLLLCDFAEEINGKLYIMGGGWSQIKADNPMNMGLALKLSVPWGDANRPLDIRISLLTEDGPPFLVNGQPLTLNATLEVGRPPGLPAGTELDAPMAFNLGGISLPADGYRWEVQVGDEVLAKASFRAHGGREVT